jgi:hypothetical protein
MYSCAAYISVLKFAVLDAGGELLKSIEGCESLGSFILTDVLPSAAMMQIGYGTSIVSFLGAVHWCSPPVGF